MELLQLDGPGWYLYLVIALTLLGGAFGLPIPEDIPLITTGVLIGNSRLNPVTAWLICYGSIVVGDMIIFGIGYKFGFAIFKSPFFRSRVSSESVTRLCLKLERHSIGLIILARHLFYMRTITFLVCGALRLKPSRFLVIDALAALMSSTLMVGLGYFASERLTELFDFLTQAKMFSLALGGVVALALTIFLLRRRYYRRS